MISQLPGNMLVFLKIAVWLLHPLLTHTKQKRNHNENSMVWTKQRSSQSKRPASHPLQWDTVAIETVEAHWSPLFSNNHRPLGFGAFSFQCHTCCHSFLHGLGWFTKQYLAILGCCFGIVILDKAIMYSLCLRLEWSLLFGCLNYSITVYPEHISPLKKCPNKSFKFTINARIPIINLLFEDCF